MKGNNPIFERNVPGSTEKLQKATVGIAGCGGLGSNAAVALVRAGIGRLILVDHDTVEASNLNRQHYFQQDIGNKKVEALAAHLRAINPEVDLVLHDVELTPKNMPGIYEEADLLIEAFDRADRKRWLIESWCVTYPDRPIVAASGVSGCGNTGAMKVHSSGNIHVCGDEQSEMTMGLCAARVMMAASMEANVAIGLLIGENG
ncbi:MAG: sulfur carrier protein ThiS adenylyltransferase ThiF [Candidatus Krumholzibacteria bacterium]|nr:sulfur carrier protein ThiS adenylyltransferase ThiF [Candidatus Krumholzibacteria bacterium]